MTNFEKLKADIQGMTAKEFAETYGVYMSCLGCNYKILDADECLTLSCEEGKSKWLESEVEE